MNYSLWLKNKYPQLKYTSSADTYALINLAKSTSRFLRFLLSTSFLVIVIVLLNTVLAANGVVPFEEFSYWLCFVPVVTFGSLCTTKLDQRIIKYQLHKIMRYKLV
ncbi:hypothetical protein [Shewanella pneumatophori]|uniref:Uncharacterized protein n=1 Tax=Shewanella pneumatophori TaxID=314092 RepID=A0A9X2CI54_9GAMM|nr:hypothetical protein [Shewanella pneumatophori]MCL1139265.1 hypothetical protein [Shewanella pneumatophori]